jgi:hypothetical protein
MLKYEGVDWIELGQDMNQWWALEDMITNLLVPTENGEFPD